jgi:hypothetical protein
MIGSIYNQLAWDFENFGFVSQCLMYELLLNSPENFEICKEIAKKKKICLKFIYINEGIVAVVV